MNDERERPAAADVRSRVIADCAALLPLASSACAAIKANQYLLQLRQVPAALLRPLRALVRSHSTED